jgi:murein DD-endopeptidase MepM/ murein hydrolase activator NlpD
MNGLGGLRRRGWGAAGALVSLGLMVAGCSTGGPAPVVNSNPGVIPPTQIIVERGQTLSGIAHAHHIPTLALAEANRLAPPYRILVGQALIIPAAGESNRLGPRLAMGEPAPPSATVAWSSPATAFVAPSPPVSAQPIPPPRLPAAAAVKTPEAAPPAAVRTPPGLAVPAANQPAPLTPPETAAVPGDHKRGSAAPVETASRAPAPIATAEPPPAAPRGGGSFLWPVRGHIVEGFGTGPSGAHNDGINISAPRGAAIEAADGGIVAYSGNELRGYGNLILIKHPGGWISAYAHCDLILVKTGQKVARGQVIARVGSTGNVSAPQLHFELRRGKKPVDPRGYLAPLSTATAREAQPG